MICPRCHHVVVCEVVDVRDGKRGLVAIIEIGCSRCAWEPGQIVRTDDRIHREIHTLTA